MTASTKKWLWRLAKSLLAAAILAGVGRYFYRELTRPATDDQPSLAQLQVRPLWLIFSAGLYVLGISFSAIYWYRLLGLYGPRPPFIKVVRAYYVSQLGKYVPGKAWALLLRGGLVRGPEVNMGVAIVTAFYEVLTTMSAGALSAALVFVVQPPRLMTMPWHPAYTGLLLLGLCVLPLLPSVFNFLTGRIAERFSQVEVFRLTPLRLPTLLKGLLITACGWWLMGLSLWCMLTAVLPEPPPLTPASWAQYSASICLANVGGFLAFVLPGGVGVREFFLLELLRFAGPEPWIAAAVLLLRLVWVAAELLVAAILLIQNLSQRR